MNVAIMLCGHFRNFHITENYWKNFLANNNCDVFISTWEDHGNRNTTEWISTQKNKINFNHILDVIKPKDYIIEDMQEKNKGFTLKKGNNSLWFLIARNSVETYDFSTYIVSQLYKIKTCFDLVESYSIENKKKYDLVFKIRADTFPENFELSRYRIIQGHLDNDVLFVYNGANHRHIGGGGGCLTCMQEYLNQKRVHQDHTNDICDYFNYGNFNVMKKLSSIYDHKDELYEQMEKHNLSLYRPGDNNVVYQKETNKYFVTWGQHIARKYKCIYPEKFIREHLKDNWILHDHFMSFIPRKFDTQSFNLRKCSDINFNIPSQCNLNVEQFKFL
jgi:hypothetical protein